MKKVEESRDITVFTSYTDHICNPDRSVSVCLARSVSASPSLWQKAWEVLFAAEPFRFIFDSAGGDSVM